MTSKTPQFDRALDEYFAKLELDEKGGQWRTCRFSGNEFYVRPEDIEFYKMMRVPLPTLEPEERRRRRFAVHNSYNLFKGISAYSGKKIVTIYPPGSPFKFYEHQVWYSDAWDPLSYAKNIDSTQPFFSQFYDLQLAVPRPALISDISNVNSDYTTGSKGLKNCYIVFDQSGGEDLYYHQCCSNDKNCIECWALDDCDTCYECKLSRNLFQCFYCEMSRNCIGSSFLWDCRNSENCFMSSGLRNKKHYFRNEYVGPEEYLRRMQEVDFGSFNEVQKLREEFRQLKLATPRKPNWNEKSENSLGDFIWSSKDVYYSLYADLCENVAYSEGLANARDVYDTFGGNQTERLYEVSNIWDENCYNVKFSSHVNGCRDVEYSDFCNECTNCFGCVGLDRKQFCIFNKQYNEEDYWRSIDQIKLTMLKRKEYGEFFPPEFLPFPYRVTIPMSYAGFQDLENAQKYGYDTSLIPIDTADEGGPDEILAETLPDNIKEVTDEILSKVIVDKNGKRFRYLRQELEFYRTHHIPLPREHPSLRMAKWMADFVIRLRFYERMCGKCGKNITTSYPPDAPEKNIWCESCYLSYIG